MTNTLQEINKYLVPDLGFVTLNPYLTTEDNEPFITPPPYVMPSPVLIPSSSYRWNYNDVRYLKMGYVLERNGSYESGELDLISKAVHMVSLDPNTYVLPQLYLNQTVIQQTDGALGVSLSIQTDSLSISEPQFGLAYQITNLLPDVYPTLRVFIIKNLPTEV